MVSKVRILERPESILIVILPDYGGYSALAAKWDESDRHAERAIALNPSDQFGL